MLTGFPMLKAATGAGTVLQLLLPRGAFLICHSLLRLTGNHFYFRHMIEIRKEGWVSPAEYEERMLYSELKCKEVINLRDCRKLGRVSDFEFDECSGCICKLIVGGGAKWKNLFGCDEEHMICYKDIKQIGPDIIIVDLPCD